MPTPPATTIAPVIVETLTCVELETMVPVVIKLPDVASIVNGPIWAPLCILKNLFAIVPYLPDSKF